VSIFVPKGRSVTEPDLAGLGDTGPESLVILENSLRGSWHGEESLLDMLGIRLEFFSSVRVDEKDCVSVFSPSDPPVTWGSNLPFHFVRVRDELKVSEPVDCFPPLSVGSEMGIEDPIEVDIGVAEDVTPN
jgi:hypothetical protein